MSGKIVFYNSLDSNFDQELWETNGITATEITPGAEASQDGLDPRYLTELGNEVLFEGVDASGSYGLWVTNGTAAGTYELTGISGANPSGLAPDSLAVYNNIVLFRGEAGVAGDDVPGLWETNGTVAGTFEIGGVGNAGIANAYSGGLLLAESPDFTLLNGKVLFNGRDAADNVGLWVTDGTAQGTVELAPISGAFAVGSPGSDVQPQYMAVLGNEVLFDGADQEDTPGSLWETNGTAAGTVEIGGQGNAGISGAPNGFSGQFTSELPLGIQPNDLTTFNGKVLFAGYDSTLKSNGYYADTDALWITDGTAAGTTEIGGLGNAGISGINPAVDGGIFWEGSIEYPDFTAYNGEALFVGYDASGHVGLWETNGTAAGTVEIGGQDNAGISGGLSLNGSENPDFTVYGNVVVFNGTDGNGHSGLWVTNGTAAGTYELTTPSFGLPNAVLGPNFTVVNQPLPGNISDVTSLAYKTTYEAVSYTTTAGTTLQIINTANSNAVVQTFNYSGLSFAGYLVTLASDGGTGTMIGLAAHALATAGAGDVVISNISGQAYSAYEQLYNSNVYTGINYFFTGVTGQAYSAYAYDYSSGNDFIGSKFDYTNVSNEPYTGYEYDYDGGGHATSIDFTGVSGTGYSSYEYDYIGGVFAGSKFEVTSVQQGATYSSYELDYNASSTFTGDKFFFSSVVGQSYTGLEEDFDASGNLAKVLLSGVTGQSYTSLEEDYSAGTYTGYKATYTGITGKSYTSEEVDVSSSNQITKVIYEGLSSTPYSSVEQDYTAGALADVIYDFTNVAGASAYSYQVEETPQGSVLQSTYDNNDGTHTIVGAAANQTFTSIGNDTITGNGASETFVFNPVYGNDTITDFSSHLTGATHDTISFSTSEFANFAAVLAGAQNVGANVVITAPTGDTLTLDNMSKTTLSANAADFTFHA